MRFTAPFSQDQAFRSSPSGKATRSDGVTSIQHTVTIAIKAGVNQNLAHIGLAVAVAILLALVGDVIGIAVVSTIDQITFVRNPVQVAIGEAFTFIGNGV